MSIVRIAYARGAIAAATVVASSFGLAASVQAEKMVWNHNVFGPPREVTRGIEAVAEFFKKESNGEIEIKIAYGSSLGPEKQIPEGVKSGAFEGGQICAGYYPNKFPLLTVMELPFITPPDTATNAKIMAAVYKHPAIVKEMTERWNVGVLATIPLPPYEFMGTKRIETTADMQGVKMRISGLNAKALQNFGAVPTMVTAPEGYTAVERGTIDVIGFPYAYTFGAYKIYEVSKYVTEGIGLGGFMCFQGIGLESWNKVPKALQDRLPEAWAASDKALMQAYKAADEKWIPIFHEKLEVTKFSAAERQKLAAGANEIWEGWVKEQEAEGRPGREMLNYVKELVAKHATN